MSKQEDWIYGINPVESAVTHDAVNVRELLVEQGATNPRVRELSQSARDAGIAVHARSREQLDRLTGGARHQGVVASYKRPDAQGEHDLGALVEAAGKDALFLILDGVQDPHNLGACLRSAEAAGTTAVIIPKDRAVGITPIVRKSSAGAADRVPLVRATNLARAMTGLRDAGVWITGLVADGDQSIHACDFRGPTALALGGEGEGLRRLTRERCDFLAKIPM
ncbi:MAG TPA: 23S rRNA (guanosine(2251)-2'-O)-methyltransferase RlmB, partial [Candidatus Saccharimonadia bacterium]|nr:23S rRNA (guanosine(2251)-2'-O)-methyltransferase RlmB [Candidatus Saccharimonadia bacterium]